MEELKLSTPRTVAPDGDVREALAVPCQIRCSWHAAAQSRFAELDAPIVKCTSQGQAKNVAASLRLAQAIMLQPQDLYWTDHVSAHVNDAAAENHMGPCYQSDTCLPGIIV